MLSKAAAIALAREPALESKLKRVVVDPTVTAILLPASKRRTACGPLPTFTERSLPASTPSADMEFLDVSDLVPSTRVAMTSRVS